MNYLFRVERGTKTQFENGQKLFPTGEYREYLANLPAENTSDFKQIIEDSLTRLGGFDRRDSLFLFHELKDALIFSSKMYKGAAMIYVVQPCGIPQRKDMNMLDMLRYAINCGLHVINPEIFDALCLNYWKDGKTFSPCYEYMANGATVINLLCDTNDCGKFHAEYSNHASPAFFSVERTSIYLNKLKDLLNYK
jgi:hypothetical protein